MGTAVIAAPPQSRARKFVQLWTDGDQIAHLVTLLFAASVFLVTVLLVYELWIHSEPSRAKFGLSFLWKQTWDPVAGQFGALPFIYGTVLTSFLALLISVPLGVGAAIFLAELAPPRVSNACTFLVELLAAVPSVIYGLLGNLYAGAFDAPVCGAIPEEHPWLSATVPRTCLWRRLLDRRLDPRHHDLPVHHFDLPGIVAGGPARTARSGPRPGRHQMGIHLASCGALRPAGHHRFDFSRPGARAGRDHGRHHGDRKRYLAFIRRCLRPGYTIAAIIANEFTEATGDVYLSALIELGLVLFALTMILNASAQLLILATTRRGIQARMTIASHAGTCSTR